MDPLLSRNNPVPAIIGPTQQDVVANTTNGINRTNNSKWTQFKRAICSPWYRKISVEPTMFLYMFAFMNTSVVEHDFFLQRACRVNNNFSDDIC
ncbi:hypothetical protein DOY81_012055, partial [Sarcophaga bullata]